MAAVIGMLRMRVNMKPDVMTSEVRTVMAAQVQRLRRMGARNRIARTNARPRVPIVPQRAQSMGAR